jgi:hypothetical protein
MTMREDDAASWDPEAVADLAQSFFVDALGFSVGGVTAFYPTDIKYHFRGHKRKFIRLCRAGTCLPWP